MSVNNTFFRHLGSIHDAIFDLPLFSPAHPRRLHRRRLHRRLNRRHFLTISWSPSYDQSCVKRGTSSMCT